MILFSICFPFRAKFGKYYEQMWHSILVNLLDCRRKMKVGNLGIHPKFHIVWESVEQLFFDQGKKKMKQRRELTIVWFFDSDSWDNIISRSLSSFVWSVCGDLSKALLDFLGFRECKNFSIGFVDDDDDTIGDEGICWLLYSKSSKAN